MSIGTLLRKARNTGLVLQKSIGQGGRLLSKSADVADSVLSAADRATGGADNFIPGVAQARQAISTARIVGNAAQKVGSARSLDEAAGAVAMGRAAYGTSRLPKTAASGPVPGSISTENPLLNM
jgi:hypothetical protein